ncbi:hypothetical protein E2C01_039877 [Portunus trituberculatus]|uniref:Uncharacterized protein n=1 Tax=Portunus trituberculatus TaxID=210409 RepID=A0A5B7FMF1_PORTR|nr:hypothetical protein [Portunus trituberculatus]
MEETLDWLSLFLSSSQGSPFFGFQTPTSQVDDSRLGTSRWAGPAGAAGPKVKMVPASAMGPKTTGGFHALVPGIGPTLQGCIGSIWAVLWLCAQLGIQISLPKSDLVPSQMKQYLGMVQDSVRALVLCRQKCLGAHLLDSLVSGVWSPQEQMFHINHLVIMAVFQALQSFQQELLGMIVSHVR